MTRVASSAERWHEGPPVAVLDRDPGLVQDLDRVTARRLRRAVVVPSGWLNPGPWTPAQDPVPWCGCLGLLVLDGVLTRSVHLEGRDAPELLGPGALLRPWVTDAAIASVPHDVRWRAHAPVTFALLAAAFTTAVRDHPVVVGRLLDRASAQGQAAAFQLAIAHVRSAERRLHLLLWHLADRWGTVAADGVHLPLRVKQEVLAHLVCLRRPTASSALQALARRGAITCLPQGGYVLHQRPGEEEPGPVPLIERARVAA